MKQVWGTTLALLMAANVAMAEPDGKVLYKENCRKCHGEDGQAHTFNGYLYFAKNLTNPAWQTKRSDEDIFRIISDSPGWYSVMPAFKKRLTEEERRALVKVVRGLAAPVAKP